MAYETLKKGSDIPFNQLFQESDFPAEVFVPQLINQKWRVVHASKGSQYHSQTWFEENEEEQA